VGISKNSQESKLIHNSTTSVNYNCFCCNKTAIVVIVAAAADDDDAADAERVVTVWNRLSEDSADFGSLARFRKQYFLC